ncbi:MAG: tetratricopeptide repeat protein [Chloroflexi bacterium]|nr:tetratricopeptide repeat protein [Chloroflexota bacterium]
MSNSQLEQMSGAALVRSLLLRTAEAWQARGQTHQAIEAYSRLLIQYPGSAEAAPARTRLLGLARDFEQKGCFHLALGLYEKLEKLG